MPIHTQIDGEAGVVTHTVQGHLRPGEIEGALQRAFRSPEFRPEMGVLWDLREGSAVELRTDELVAAALTARSYGSSRGHGRTALLVESAVDFGLARVAQAYLQELPREVEVFTTYDEAITWLRRT